MSNPIIEKPAAKYDVVIVGSGFSGIVAAGLLADRQLDVLMVDENVHLGGQLLRKIPEVLGNYSRYKPDYVKKIGFAFVENVKTKKIHIMNRTCVAGVFPGNRLLMETAKKEIHEVTATVILFATGARERYVPFKGWTLPGVYSTGMTQVLMKSSGVLPGRNIVVGGSGLFLFSVAYEILKNKGKIPAVLEQTGMLGKLKILPALLHQFSKVAEGARYMSKLFFKGVPVRYRRKIVEARGQQSLEEVVTGKVDGNGKLIEGTEKIIKADALAVGFGFVPNIEAPHMAGCALEYAQGNGGWTVTVNDQLETSIENILAAGEITGVGGALKSINEGKIAGYTILRKFEKISAGEFQQTLAKLTRERKHHQQFTYYFNSLYQIPPGIIEDIPEETVVCRCEDITFGTIKKGIANGYTSPKALKSFARLSMGNCQGRTCGPVVDDILSLLTGKHPGESGPFHSRPPLKPLSIDALANLEKN